MKVWNGEWASYSKDNREEREKQSRSSRKRILNEQQTKEAEQELKEAYDHIGRTEGTAD